MSESAESKRLREVLWTSPRDYEPWGVADREGGPQGWGGDCSCGCRFYEPLEGILASDWGVCTNPKSHRCGLLTFEHQGCFEFVYDERLESTETP